LTQLLLLWHAGIMLRTSDH